MIDTIERECTKLRTTCLRDYPKILEMVGEEPYASLLYSFGSRTFCAPVHKLSVTKYAQVVVSCSNLLIRSWFACDRWLDEWERVRLLGSIIPFLVVDANACRQEQCEEAIAKYTRLEELGVNRAFEYSWNVSVSYEVHRYWNLFECYFWFKSSVESVALW